MDKVHNSEPEALRALKDEHASKRQDITFQEKQAPSPYSSARAALEQYITKIQKDVLSHERALRLIGSRMPLFNAMDETKQWLKAAGKFATDEEFNAHGEKLRQLLEQLDQKMCEAETALKQFHELRQVLSLQLITVRFS
ncbi:unnamed protein product [Echinostoma caproni]|uniref:BAR domain-containing protein n=1 Tax=Echinostoma caproni TaxID=27848 RepID=A0A183AE53_9TREM|nr:unnamed protein product [Echinostoma caproni]